MPPPSSPSASPFDLVTAIIITYNSSAVIADCLAALGPIRSVIMVDNASSDDSCARARTARPDARILENPRNEGYSVAANRGAMLVETPYLLTITPDALLDAGALEILVRAAEANPNAALVAPLTFDPQDRPDLSAMGPSEINHRPLPETPAGPYCTWFVTAAVWLWRMSAWRALGGFDEAIFLYNNDAEFCIRATRAGYALVVVPEARARHLGGRSTPVTSRIQLRKDWHQVWAHLYLERTHGDAVAADRLALRQIFRFAGKALFYALVFRWRRAAGNAVKVDAAIWHLLRRPARRP